MQHFHCSSKLLEIGFSQVVPVSIILMPKVCNFFIIVLPTKQSKLLDLISTYYHNLRLEILVISLALGAVEMSNVSHVSEMVHFRCSADAATP